MAQCGRGLFSATLALLGFITFVVADLHGNRLVRAGGAVILGTAVLVAVGQRSLWRRDGRSTPRDAGSEHERGDSARGVAQVSTRRLFIISLDHPEFYERALRTFRGQRETQVIYDRRLGQRRQGGPALAVERRRGERRRRANVDAEITAFGSAVVLLE